MIDLRQKWLPSCITIDGRSYEIKTDYREWLDFADRIARGADGIAPLVLFQNKKDILTVDWQQLANKLIDFWKNENSTPKASGKNNIRIIDFVEDGEYIYSSFLQIYNIDLLKTDMHWWKFQALFRSLPDVCKIREIMGFRAYKKQAKTKPETKYQRAKEAWALPADKIDKEDKQTIEDLFYNA